MSFIVGESTNGSTNAANDTIVENTVYVPCIEITIAFEKDDTPRQAH